VLEVLSKLEKLKERIEEINKLVPQLEALLKTEVMDVGELRYYQVEVKCRCDVIEDFLSRFKCVERDDASLMVKGIFIYVYGFEVKVVNIRRISVKDLLMLSALDECCGCFTALVDEVGKVSEEIRERFEALKRVLALVKTAVK